MLGFRLRVSGVGDVTCIAQSTTIEVPSGADAFFGTFTAAPLPFVKQADGTRVTSMVLTPGPLPARGQEFALVSQAAGQTARVRLRR
jgi:hypothetical protein